MPRRGVGVLCGTVVRAASLTLLVAVTGCSDESTGATAVHSTIGAAAGMPTASAINDDTFRAAVNCPDCTVVGRSATTLPLTGKNIVEEKLISSSGTPHEVALDPAGNSIDARSLLASEGTAKIARQGKLRDAVYARSVSSSSDIVPVSIWADFVYQHAPRRQMVSDPSFRAARQAQTATQLQAVTSKVTAWLDGKGFVTHNRGLDTPLITAEVPASALVDLGRLDGVSSVDLTVPEVRNGWTWFDAVKAPAAQYLVSSVSGNEFCNGEGYQPDQYTYLSYSGIYDSSAAKLAHTRWTSELISSTSYSTMAPGAEFFLPAYFVGSSDADRYAAWSWCFSDWGIWNMNRSAGTNYGAIGPVADDMALDYYAVNWPYPLITASAGNCVDGYGAGVDCVTGSPLYGAYTDNRSYNTLIVGSSDSYGSPQTSDDFMSSFSQYINPVTTHNDFELPEIVAPGSDIYASDIDSASHEDAGTSASSAITMGAALLMETQDYSLTYYPEVEKALLIDASTHPVDGSRPQQLGWQDLKQGGGLLNALNAIEYANPTYAIGPNSTPAALGHWVTAYDFSTDFPAPDYVAAPFNIQATITGRLRVVIAWDATAQGCSTTDGSGCASEAIDADLDLHLFKYVSGSWEVACSSGTWDGSWEMCDIPVTLGDQYKAEIYMNSANSAGTYLGIAWSNYDPNDE